MKTTLLALGILALFTSTAAAQHVVVLLDEGALRTELARELDARTMDATFEPRAPDPYLRAAELDASLVVFFEGDGAGALLVGPLRRPTRLAAMDDPSVLAAAAAALLEGHRGPRPERPYHVPAVGLYTGVEVFGYARFAALTDGHVGVRSSLGLQLREGFRVGVVYAFDGFSWSTETGSSWGLSIAAGGEVGFRFEDELVAVHVGGHVLAGPGRYWADGNSRYIVQAGGYVGLGFWLDPRLELGLRGTGEVWEEPGYGTTPVARLSARIEWR